MGNIFGKMLNDIKLKKNQTKLTGNNEMFRLGLSTL